MDRSGQRSRGLVTLLTATGLLVGAVALAPAASAGALTIISDQAARAEQPQTPEGFEPVANLPPHEQLPAAPLLIAAYAFVWVMILVFVWSVWRRIGAVQKELSEVERRLEEVGRR